MESPHVSEMECMMEGGKESLGPNAFVGENERLAACRSSTRVSKMV